MPIRKIYTLIIVFLAFLLLSFFYLPLIQATTTISYKKEIPGNKTIPDTAVPPEILFTGEADFLYYIKKDNIANGNLTIDCSTPSCIFSPLTATNNRTVVFFIDGDLNIKQNYTYGSPTTGTVFVVKGNVYISPSVTRIDAVIISGKTICTAANFSSSSASCPANYVTVPQQLVVNGSLISLTDAFPIAFRRTLDPNLPVNNNNTPAEKVNNQVKYLVILKDLISGTAQQWSEIP